MHLYELSNDYQKVWDLMDNPDIPEDAILDTLEGIQGEIKVKAVDIACFIKDLRATVAAFKAEEDTLKKRRQTIEKRTESLTDYLAKYLQMGDLTEVKDPRASISFRASKATRVTNPDELLAWAKVNRPAWVTVPDPIVSIMAVRDALKKGEEVPGAEIVTNQNIQIK